MYMLAGTPLTPFHGDESTLIYMSRDYAYQFIQRDLDKVRFSDPAISLQEQNLRLLNGTISKVAIGLAWHLGGFTISDLNEQWDWGGNWDYNVQTGHKPGDSLLRVTRWSSSLMMAASAIVLFAIGWHLGGRRVAYVASLYYALNPGLLINGQRAMMEGSYALFTLLTVLAGIWLLKRGVWWAALLLGVFEGLALASKHTAVMTLVAVFGAIGVAWIYGFVQRMTSPLNPLSTTASLWRGDLLKLLVAGMVALATFYVMNPAWWGDPLSRARHVLDLREELLAIQVSAFGGYADVADQIAGFTRQALIVQPQYYEVAGWQETIGAEIAAYEASPWHGISIGGSPLGAALLLVMILLGIWQMIRRPDRARWLIDCWAIAVVALTLGLTPLEWQRYYLPVYPVIGLLATLGLDAIWRTIVNLTPQQNEMDR